MTRAALRWLRLEDEQGKLCLTTALLFFACALVPFKGLYPLALALAAYVLHFFLQHCRAQTIVNGAHEAQLRMLDAEAEERLKQIQLGAEATAAMVNLRAAAERHQQELQAKVDQLEKRLTTIGSRAAEIEMGTLRNRA